MLSFYDYNNFGESNPSCMSCTYLPNYSQEWMNGDVCYTECYSPVDSEVDCCPSFDCSSMGCCSCFDCCSSIDCGSSVADCSSTCCCDTFLETSDTPLCDHLGSYDSISKSVLLPRGSSVFYRCNSSLRLPSFAFDNESMIPADESAMFAMTLPNQDVAFPTSVSSEVLFNEQEMKAEEEMSTSENNMDSNDNSNTNSNDMTTEETTQDQNEINESSVETSQSKSELSYSEQEQEREPEPEPERKHARGRSEEREQESDGDWMLLPETEIFENPSGRSPPKMWTKEECNRLHTAINRFGVGHWTEISRYVGTRCVSQCINKWKNSLSKKRERWTAAATKQLKEYVQSGASEKEIAKLMPQYTYIQLYQQIRKLRTNTSPWAEWETELLIKLKLEGRLGDTEIGRQLNNRHRDNVKNVWNRIKREQHL